MPKMKETVAKANAETLREAREFGANSRIEIVQVTHDDPAYQCKAVWRYRDQKFKLSELPALPLPDCTSKECDCTYILALAEGP